MNLIEAIKQQPGTSFTREEIKHIAREHKIKTKETQSFLSNANNRHQRGRYGVAIAEAKPQKVETDEEVSTRICDRFEVLTSLTVSSVSGETRALIVSGPPGLGKTHTVTTTVETFCIDGVVAKLSGSASAVGLYRALSDTRQKGSVLIIDDCDTIFTDLISLSLLKGACDSTKKRMLRWTSEYHFGGEHIDREFEYNGTIIFITNIDFDLELTRKSRLTPHIDALMSRAHYLTLGIKTRRDYIIRIKDVITEMYTRGEFAKEEAQDAVNFINRYAGNLRELSCRTAIKLTQLRKSIPHDWERIARITMCKE
jgi:hypothetical protein